MLKTSNPPDLPTPLGTYSQVVEVPATARWAVLAGQVPIRPDGTVPEGFAAQHDQAWENIIIGLAHAGMGAEDIVRVTVNSTDPTGITANRENRKKFVGDHRPASTWLVVSELRDPAWLLEIDVWAAKVD